MYIVEKGDDERLKALVPVEDKDIIFRKDYEKAQNIYKNIKKHLVTESTRLTVDLVNIVGSYFDDEACASMQAVPIPCNKSDDAWDEYRKALMNAANKSASCSSSALPSSSLAGAVPSHIQLGKCEQALACSKIYSAANKNSL